MHLTDGRFTENEISILKRAIGSKLVSIDAAYLVRFTRAWETFKGAWIFLR